jgi:hypothetical protein
MNLPAWACVVWLVAMVAIVFYRADSYHRKMIVDVACIALTVVAVAYLLARIAIHSGGHAR